MLVPLPLPDEYFKGHVGRVGLLNSFYDYAQTSQEIRRATSAPGSDKLSDHIHSSLASLVGMSKTDYLCLHSTLPCISFFRRKSLLGKNARWLNQDIGRSPARVAGYCGECIREDIYRYGFSYWRRSHQLPGMAWCLKHKHPLSRNQSTYPFDELPQNAEGNAMTDLEFDSIPDVLRRFLTCSELLLNQRNVIEEVNVKTHIAALARAHKFRCSARGSLPLVSDFVLSTFPYQWLAGVFPSISIKQPNKFFPAIDTATIRTHTNSGPTSFLIVLSMLFNDPVEAVNWLFDGSNTGGVIT